MVGFYDESSFELPKKQLLKLIEQFQPHLKPTLVKESGQRWSDVLEGLYDEKEGLLKRYKKIKDVRNFRTCFIEKVFKKAEEMVVLGRINNLDPPASILQLHGIGVVFFQYKKMEKMAGRNELRMKKHTIKMTQI